MIEALLAMMLVLAVPVILVVVVVKLAITLLFLPFKILGFVLRLVVGIVGAVFGLIFSGLGLGLALLSVLAVAVLHYAPIAATVVGEPPEIYPFLGSSRLEEPLNRYEVDAVFHGHAHRGSLEGRTTAGAPVYNVAMPLLKKAFPDRPPVRFVEIAPPSDPERERRSGVPTRRAEDRTP